MPDRPRLNDQQAQWLGATLASNRKRQSLRSWLTREEAAFFAAPDHGAAQAIDLDFGRALDRTPR